MGKLCVALACIDAREVPGEAPPGGVVIRDGELQRIYANLNFPDPGITLFPGVQLNRIGAGFGLNPSRLLGGARVTAVGIFEIDGALALAFPSSAQPFILRRDEVGQAFPAKLYDNRYTTVTMAIGADAYLKVPLLDTRMRLGGAYLLYNAPGYVAFGGGIDFDFFDIVSISGHADGRVQRRQRTIQPRRAREGLRRRHHLRRRRRKCLRHRGRRLRERRRSTSATSTSAAASSTARSMWSSGRSTAAAGPALPTATCSAPARRSPAARCA